MGGRRPSTSDGTIPTNTVLLAYRGSIAHGMYVAPVEPTGIDDKDVIAIYVDQLDRYFGLPSGPARGGHGIYGEWDVETYEFRHLVGLLTNGNPNVLSLLWTKSEHILKCGPLGYALRQARGMFMSKRIYNSYGGYANAQIERMTSFKDVVSTCGCEGEFHSAQCQENLGKGRGSTKRFARGHMGEKRKSLVQQFGYDTKNAAHAIRLLTQGIEALLTGNIEVDRREAGDAEYLLSIKRGKHDLQFVKRHAQELFAELKRAAAESRLPDEPDRQAISAFATRALARHFSHTIQVEAGL